MKSKIKIQTTEAGFTITMKFPESDADVLLPLYGKECTIIEAVKEGQPMPLFTADSLSTELDNQLTGLLVLSKQIKKELLKKTSDSFIPEDTSNLGEGRRGLPASEEGKETE